MRLKTETNSQGIELKPEIEARLKQHVLSRFNTMKTYRDQLDVYVIRWLKLYNAFTEDKDYDWQSNIFVPYTYILIQTLLPRLRSTLFGSKNIVSVEAQVAEFLHAENGIATWFNQKLRKMGFFEKAREVILASLKYPIGILKVRWNYNNKIIKKKGFLGIGETKSIRDLSDPDCEVINWFDFWWDPNATSVKGCRDMIQRSVRDLSYLNKLQKAGVYENIDLVKDTRMPTDIVEIKQELNLFDTSERTSYNKEYTEGELLEYHGPFDINEDGIDEDIIFTFVNREIGIRVCVVENDGVSDYKIFKPLVEDNQYTGMPQIKMIESQQAELNTTRNQRVDNVNLILRKLFKARLDASIDPEQVFSGPGNVMWLEDMDDIQEFKTSDVTQNAAANENSAISDMQQTLGISDYWMRPAAKASDTVRGMMQMSNEMANRFQDMVLNLVPQFEDVFSTIMMKCAKYKTTDEYYRNVVKGVPQLSAIKPELLQGEYLFRLNLKNISSASTELQAQLIQLLNVVGKLPFINVKELVKSILESFDIKNIDEIMTVPEANTPPALPGAIPGAPAGIPNIMGGLTAPVNSTLPSISGMPGGSGGQ